LATDLSPSFGLAEELGITNGARVALVNEPEDFSARLEPLPADVRFFERATEPLDVIIYFSDTLANVAGRIPLLAPHLAKDGVLWMAYPDESAATGTDISLQAVKRVGARSGLSGDFSFLLDDTWRAVRLKSEA
jgi:hypothetical protein